MESLGKIFGSKDKVKIMRLFLQHPAQSFDIDDVVLRTQSKKLDLRKEINILTKIGFMKKVEFSKKVELKTKAKDKKITYKKVSKKGWKLNSRFDLIDSLYTLLLGSELIKDQDLVKRFKGMGRIKLFVLSGLFLSDENRELDILIVGEKLNREKIDKEILVLESEFGREISYGVFSVEEYEYRVTMYDKLIRDVMENNNRVLINKK